MKKIILTLITLSFWVFASAQSHLHLKSGKSFSSFLFKDSESFKEKDLDYAFNNYFAISYDNYLSERNILRAEFGLREAGAKAIIDEVKYEWNFNYLDLQVAYLFKYLGNEKYGLHVGAAPYLGFLLTGEQSVGQTYYNVKKERAIKTVDFGVNFLTNAQFRVAENIYVTLEYRYGLGLLNIETDGDNPDQVTRNRSHFVLAGLSFNLNKK